MGASGKLIAFCLALAASVFPCAAVSASPVPTQNPWLSQAGILNMAHQGGEMEAPSSTIYAFRTAIEDRGADSLEMDVNATSDGRLMVMHDYYTSRITPVDAQVRDLTAAQVQALDAAWWFTPGDGQFNHSLPAAAYPFRGVRTGEVPPPEGFTADDFRIPTIEEVLDAFPDVPLNIEIKGVPSEDQEAVRVATLLAGVLDRPEYAGRRIIVTSLDQDAIVAFHELAPQVDLGASVTAMIGLIGGGKAIDPPSVALQVPMYLGEMEPARVLQEMDVASMGYAVHAWTTDRADENDTTYARLIDSGVQGIISSAPSRLADYLCRAGVRRPSGAPRCEAQEVHYRLRFPSRSLGKLIDGRFPITIACDQACGATVGVSIPIRVARRFGIMRRPLGGRPYVTVGAGGSPNDTRVRIGISSFDRRRLARAKKLRVRLRVEVYDAAAWNEAVEYRWLTLRTPKPTKPPKRRR